MLLNNNQWLCGDSEYSFIANLISLNLVLWHKLMIYGCTIFWMVVIIRIWITQWCSLSKMTKTRWPVWHSFDNPPASIHPSVPRFNLTLSQETAVCHPKFQPTLPLAELHVSYTWRQLNTTTIPLISCAMRVCISGASVCAYAHSQSGTNILGDVNINKRDLI